MARRGDDPALRELAAVVALLRNGSHPSNHYADLIESAGGAESILEQEHGLLAPELIDGAGRDVEHWVKQGIRPLSVLDPDYPANLRAVHDRPALIFLAGSLIPTDERAVAVIGSRRASPSGLELAHAITTELTAAGYTIVSGLAAGIDTVAHTTALSNGARTIAVLGNGLTRCYPPQNAGLQRRIASEGALVSQFWPETAPSRETFPMRNAVMSGMALATVIVEAGRTSGARTQARWALAHGRPVLLAHGLLRQGWARELAGRPGTHVIGTPREVPAVVERIASTQPPLG